METIVLSKLMRTGTSLAVVIPKYMLDQLGFRRGDYFSVTVRDPGVLVLRGVTDAEIRSLKMPTISYE